MKKKLYGSRYLEILSQKNTLYVSCSFFFLILFKIKNELRITDPRMFQSSSFFYFLYVMGMK